MLIQSKSEEEVLEYLTKYYAIRPDQKKTNGEVFTKIELVDILLDKLPKKVWSKPHYTWLDPSAGVGNFLIPIYFRLMNGLRKQYPNKSQRQTHILEKMLFGVEIDNRNIQVLKNVLGLKANIIKHDFLTASFSHGFDIIVGNPPFQEDSSGGNKGGKGKLYEKFVEKSLEYLTPGGYVSFIIPTNLFGGGTPLYETLVQKRIPFINFNKELERYFPSIQQKICIFMLQNKASVTDSWTTIENQTGTQFKIKLKNRPVNPIHDWTPYTEKLIHRYISDTRNAFVYNRGLSISSYRGKQYCLFYKPNSFLYTNNQELAVGIGVPKVVVYVISIELKSELDDKGKCGVGPNIVYYPIQNVSEGNKLYAFLQSEEYKIMARATKINRQFIKLGFLFYLNMDKILSNSNSSKRVTKTHRTRKGMDKKTRKKK